jgi:hypothetical protein
MGGREEGGGEEKRRRRRRRAGSEDQRRSRFRGAVRHLTCHRLGSLRHQQLESLRNIRLQETVEPVSPYLRCWPCSKMYLRQPKNQKGKGVGAARWNKGEQGDGVRGLLFTTGKIEL